MATSKDVLASLAIRIGIDSANMSKSLNKISSDMNIFKNGLKTIGKTMAGLFAVDTVIGFGKSTFNSFLESEKAARKLTTALKGNVEQFKELNDLAKGRQSVTTFSDEESLNAMTRMRSIMGDNMEAIKRLLPLVQDLAVVKEMDLSSAADLVAKSIATQTNALKRQGIVITGAAGSSERLESAVNALSKAFGGQAEALGGTLSGQLIKTQNAWDDIKESIGAVLSGPVERSSKAFQVWAEVISSNASAWEKWKATFTGGDKLVEQFNEKYEKLSANLERIKNVSENQPKPDKNGWYMSLPGSGVTGAIGTGNSISESNSLLEEAKQKLEEYKKASEEAITEADLAKWNRKIQLQEKEIDRLNKLGQAVQQLSAAEQKANLADMAGSVTGSYMTQPLTPKTGKALLSYDENGNETKSTSDMFAGFKAKKEEYINGLLEMQKATQEATAIIKTMVVDMATTFAEAIGTMIGSGQQANWSLMLIPIADAMSSLGRLMITAGLALEALQAAITSFGKEHPAIAVIGGIALVAAAAAIRAGVQSSLGNTSSHISSASISGGVSSAGSNYLYRNMGEGYGTLRVEVTGKIQGDVIKLSGDRAAKQLSRW